MVVREKPLHERIHLALDAMHERVRELKDSDEGSADARERDRHIRAIWHLSSNFILDPVSADYPYPSKERIESSEFHRRVIDAGHSLDGGGVSLRGNSSPIEGVTDLSRELAQEFRSIGRDMTPKQDPSIVKGE